MIQRKNEQNRIKRSSSVYGEKKLHRGFRYGISILTLSAVLLLGGCAMGEAQGEKTVQGIAALNDGEYQQAKELFEDAVRNNEDEMLAYRGLGIAYMGLADYEKAEQAFEAALDYIDERQPENRQDLELYLATVQYRMGDYEETADTCTEILEKAEKGVADAFFLRGASYLHEGNTQEAREDFDEAAALAPNDYDLYLNIYECYRQMNISGIGSDFLQAALNIQGDDLEHAYNRGRVYYYLEDYEEAQKQLIGPVEAKHEDAMVLIGKVYLALEDYEHAQAVYQQLEQEFGSSAESCSGLAMCAMYQKEYDTALAYIAQGLELGGTAEKQELYFNEIIIYEKKLDFAAAKEKARAYVERYPSDEAGQKEWIFLSTR